MASFEDIKERVQSEFKNQWEQFQETSIYNQARERYENMTPIMQKLTVTIGLLVVTYFFLSFPLSYFGRSSDHVAEFEGNRQTIRDLLKASRESQDTPDIPLPPPVDALKSQIDGQIQAARLLPEQIIANEASAEPSRLIPGNLSQGMVKVSLAKLNLRQVLDLGFMFQTISPSAKMVDILMEANRTDPHYYDVIYRLAVLAVPNPESLAEPEPPAKRKGK